MTHPHSKRSFVPQAVLTKSGKLSIADATVNTGNPQKKEYKEKEVIDSGRISGKGKIKTGSLDFDDVYFCKELKYNLLSVSQIYDKKNNVLFTDTECLVLSFDFNLLDESQVLLRVPRKDNIYSVDLKSVVPTKGLTCLIAKAIIDESNTWHKSLGHINFKTMNKLVKGNLVKGLPSKIFENDHSCVACQKGKQHKASYKTKLVNSMIKLLHMLQMDLFGPTNVKSLMKRTPQQNGVAERKNRTLIEAARTMLVDSKLPTTFGLKHLILLILCANRDHLGKFDGKANEGYFARYSVVSKAMRVFNKRTRIVEETLNIRFLENTTNVKGNRPDWLFNIDSLTISMNYVPVVARNKINGIAGTKDNIVAGPKDCEWDTRMKPTEVDENEASDKTEHTNSSNGINIVSTPVSTAGPSFDTAVPSTPVNTVGPSVSTANEYEEQLFERFSPFKNEFTLPPVPNISSIDNTGIIGNAYNDEDVEEEVDMNNVISSYTVPDTSFTKFHKDHPEDQVIRSLKTHVQTRHMTKINEEHGLISSVHKLRRTNHKDFQNCLFACFLSQMEPKKPVQALKDPSWVEAMQDELLQFKLLKVWTLVDLPRDKWAIGTK
ncbi:putative ribonuclease H-like domain-containing protein [Tanacetum coccineum]